MLYVVFDLKKQRLLSFLLLIKKYFRLTFFFFLGEGSLISYLRKKVWAMNLCAGNEGDGFDFNTTGSLFNVNIVLTKSGHENIREVKKKKYSQMKERVLSREEP